MSTIVRYNSETLRPLAEGIESMIRSVVGYRLVIRTARLRRFLAEQASIEARTSLAWPENDVALCLALCSLKEDLAAAGISVKQVKRRARSTYWRLTFKEPSKASMSYSNC